MWYYKKDGNIIGPASARKIVSMRELGIITDSTPVSRKRNAKNWETFGGLSENINLESSQWDRQSHVQSGLAKNTMILRALLVSTIAVMCVLIFYTLQNYNLLGEYRSLDLSRYAQFCEYYASCNACGFISAKPKMDKKRISKRVRIIVQFSAII